MDYFAAKYLIENATEKTQAKPVSRVGAIIGLLIVGITLFCILYVIINPKDFFDILDYLAKAFDNWFLNL